jgi:hypothetical protein
MQTESKDIRERAPDGQASDAVDASKSKRELYHEARNAGIERRSSMNKEHLVEALRKLQATSVPRERTKRHSRSEREPASRQVLRRPGNARGPDRCAIVYTGSGRYGEFHVIVTEKDGSSRSVARSAAFRAPRFGRLRRRGPARVAHELLVSRLEACEWWPVDSGGPWHELQFVRLRGEDTRSRRSLVTVVREARQARFVAEELDSYGGPTPLMLSAPFGAPRFSRVRPSMEAKVALKHLVRRMESQGWKVAAAVGKDWYAIALSRPARTDWRSLTQSSRPGRPAEEQA